MAGTAERADVDRASAPRGAQGAIPFRLRVGVTGHRVLDDPIGLAARVGQTLQRVRELAPASPSTPVHLVVISPLAEGADRLVAEAALDDERASLEVPLPLPVDEYIQDFSSDTSKQEFSKLLDEAGVITILPPADSRDAAYEQVGYYVVDRCDVLIALWDGNPARGYGGTADIVARARDLGVPIIWIHTALPHDVTEELGSGISLAAFHELDAYNRSSLNEEKFVRSIEGEVSRYAAAAEEAGLGTHVVGPFLEWIWAYFARADQLAVRYQALYVRFAMSQFLLGAAAVTVVAAQLLFFPTHPEYAWFEVALMLSLLGILFISRRWRLHERWISHRYLAEQFRTAFFLALAGVGDSRQLSADRANAGHGAEEWMDRAYDEVWSQRPDASAAESHLEQLKQFLGTFWIIDQRNYHEKVSHRNERNHRRLTNASAILFTITLLAAVLHAVGVGHESHDTDLHASAEVASVLFADPEHGPAPADASHGAAPPSDLPSLPEVLTFLAIVLPAVAGALGGIHAQREYHRNAERFGRMVPVLDAANRRLQRATDAVTLQGVVEDVENLLLDEVRDWFVVMRFHDIELHV
jgi:hypothetical protein